LALFNLAIDSKLRGCDLITLRVADVAPHGYAIDLANVRQRKTGRPVRFELTEQTRQSLDAYLRSSGRKPGQVLFPGRGADIRSMTRLLSSMGPVTYVPPPAIDTMPPPRAAQRSIAVWIAVVLSVVPSLTAP